MDFLIGLWLFLIVVLIFSNGIVISHIQNQIKTPPDYQENHDKNPDKY